MPIPRRVGQWNKAGLNKVTRRIAPWMPGLGVVVHRGRRSVERQVLRAIRVADFLSLKAAPVVAPATGQS